MGLFSMFKSEKTEVRAIPKDVHRGSFSISSFFGGGSKISEDAAMAIPAVSSSVELITSSISQLPVYLYQEKPNGEVVKISSDKRVFLLNHEPNELISANTFKKRMVKDYLLHGASYTKIERRLNDVVSLYNLPVKEISVTKYRQFGYKHTAVISLTGDDSTSPTTFSTDELVIVVKDSEDGVTSKGVLDTNGELLRLALDEINYSSGILKNGALPIGVLKASSRLTSESIQRLRSSFENLYSGSKNSGKTLILEEGLDYQPVSMKPNEMDLTNSKKNTVSDVARVFNLPESMINPTANKYASNEQNNIHYLQYCISPIVTSIENSLDKSLLLEEEKQNGYFFQFDTSEILRTTEKEKIDTTVRAMERGLISINEARSKINLPPLEVDYFTWSLGSIFYNPKTNEMTIPNMGTTIDPDEAQKVDSNQEQSDLDGVKE